MKTFNITITKRVRALVTIEADSEAEARAKFAAGNWDSEQDVESDEVELVSFEEDAG